MARILLVIASAMFLLATADVAPVTPDPTDDKIYHLFYNLCRNGNIGEAGLIVPMKNHEKSFVYCRQAGTNGESSILTKPQVIFLEPPAIDQKHNVILNADKVQGEGLNTRVYVVPPKVTNQYKVELKPQPNEMRTHTVYYLDEKVHHHPLPERV